MKIRNNRKGFTLIELLVVIAIIGILAAMALPKLMKSITIAKEARTKSDLNALRKAVQMYFFDVGHFPYRLTGDSSDGDWPDWSTEIIPAFQNYISAIPQCKVSPDASDAAGVWNIVNNDTETRTTENGWRYGMWQGQVTVNNGGTATDGTIYSNW